jgi:hypothetical protein
MGGAGLLLVCVRRKGRSGKAARHAGGPQGEERRCGVSEEAHPTELTGIEAEAASFMEIWLQDGLNEPDWDTVMFRVRAAMAARQAMGREKYKMTLTENPAPLRERVRHLWEEMLDGLAYSQWCRNAANEHQENDMASSAAWQCITRISEALVELDRLMRALGMEPVKKGGADE